MERKQKIGYIAENYRQIMMKAAIAILGNVYDAEDAYQETIIKLFRLVDNIEDVTSSSAKMYCTVILKNTARDMVRKKRHQIPTENVAEMIREKTSNEVYSVEANALLYEVEALPEIYKSILLYRCLNNISALETAREMKMTVSGVNTRLLRARKILRSQLYA